MKKIAFCFLITDGINHEDLWNIFFKNVDENKYNIYIHYKTNKQLKYFEKFKLNNCIETRYENHTIPLSYNVLFREAYADPDNYKFQIISGSCIPLKSFDVIYNKLTSDNFGYFNICPQEQCFPSCNSLLNFIEHKYISKSHNWFILNRVLVEKLCFEKNDEILNKHYTEIYAPAEYYYYTYIKVFNLENEIITTENIACDATTFTNWQGMDYKYPSNRGLKNYYSITEDELIYLLNSKSLFGRKFDSMCVDLIIEDVYINCITSK